MTVTFLQKLQERLKQEVCDKIELRESADDNIENYRIVHPSCFIGWIPPNQSNEAVTQAQQKSSPCMVIGASKSVDNGECEEVDIVLFFYVYSPGFQGDDKKLVPNFEGYKDLLNFMDKTKAYLLKDSFQFDFMIINSEIESAVDQEQPYPHWIGNMKFKAKYEAYPNIDRSKYL